MDAKVVSRALSIAAAVTQMDRDYFGGIHLEGAWSLGPRIGIDDWESTLRLYRLCQRARTRSLLCRITPILDDGWF